MIVFTSLMLSLAMLVTPYGYDDGKTQLPNTGQCEWQSATFVLFSEARWWFTVILFQSECRKIILDTWPSTNIRAHHILAWSVSGLWSSAGWILTQDLGFDDIYGWQWSGRCGIKTSTDPGALFLMSRLILNVIMLAFVFKYFTEARVYLYRKNQMRSHSADNSIAGMWVEEQYNDAMSRHSIYFIIGGSGVLIKMSVMFWEVLLVLSHFGELSDHLDTGKVAVLTEVIATVLYAAVIFFVLLIMNWGSIKRSLCLCCTGPTMRSEPDFCFLDEIAMPPATIEKAGEMELLSLQWLQQQSGGELEEPSWLAMSPRSSSAAPSPISPYGPSPTSTKVFVSPLAVSEQQ